MWPLGCTAPAIPNAAAKVAMPCIIAVAEYQTALTVGSHMHVLIAWRSSRAGCCWYQMCIPCWPDVAAWLAFLCTFAEDGYLYFLPKNGSTAFTAALAGEQSQAVMLTILHLMPVLQQSLWPCVSVLRMSGTCTCLNGRLLYQFPWRCLLRGHE